jgi:hypothetical protein
VGGVQTKQRESKTIGWIRILNLSHGTNIPNNELILIDMPFRLMFFLSFVCLIDSKGVNRFGNEML